jgi:hypothetical protein
MLHTWRKPTYGDTKNKEKDLIPLKLAGFMVYFKRSIPTSDEIESLNQYCSTQNDTLWNLLIFSDQVTDKSSKQFIDNERNFKSLSFKSNPSSDIVNKKTNNMIPQSSFLIHLMLLILVQRVSLHVLHSMLKMYLSIALRIQDLMI